MVYGNPYFTRPANIQQPAQWTIKQTEALVAEFRTRRPIDEIVAKLEQVRSDVTEASVLKYVRTKFGGLRKCLETFIANAAEIEEILRAYPSIPQDQTAAQPDKEGGKAVQPSRAKAYHPFENNPLGERDALHQVIADGLVQNADLNKIVAEAGRRGIPTTFEAVAKVLRMFRGPCSFLEHVGKSHAEASEIASRYAHY